MLTRKKEKQFTKLMKLSKATTDVFKTKSFVLLTPDFKCSHVVAEANLLIFAQILTSFA
jgi:hypothetical protein